MFLGNIEAVTYSKKICVFVHVVGKGLNTTHKGVFFQDEGQNDEGQVYISLHASLFETEKKHKKTKQKSSDLLKETY